MRIKARDEYFSRENRYSLGADELSGRRYLSIPVSTRVVDYEEYFEVAAEHYALLLADPALALAFAEECRRHEHDDLLLQEPGWNRGSPV